MNWLKIENSIPGEVNIDLEGVIGGGFFEEGITAEKVNEDLRNFRDSIQNVRRINVNILNSPGGSVMHALAIYDLLTTHRAEIITNGVGMIASAATVIFQAASKGNRYLSPNAKFLIHRVRGAATGTPDEMQADIEMALSFEKSIISIYAKHTGKSEDELLEDMNKNNGMGEFWDSEKVIENGFADSVMKTYKVAAQVEYTPEQLFQMRINNQKNKEMNIEEIKNLIAENVNSALESLGLKKTDEQKVSDVITAEVEKIRADYDEKIKAFEATIAEFQKADNADVADLKNAITEKDVVIAETLKVVEAKDAEIVELKNKVEGLESEVAKSKAGKTKIDNVDAAIDGEKLSASDKAALKVWNSIPKRQREIYTAK